MELRRGYAMPDLSGQLGGSAGGMEVGGGLVGPMVIFDYDEKRVGVEFMTALDRIRIKYGHIACAEYDSGGNLISGAVSLYGLAGFVMEAQSELAFDVGALAMWLTDQGVIDLTLKVDLEEGGANVRVLGESETRFRSLDEMFVEKQVLMDPDGVVSFEVGRSGFFAGVRLGEGGLLLGLGDKEKMVVFGIALRVETTEVLKDLSAASLERFLREIFAPDF